MTSHVTDTNVGKMTEQGAIEIIQAEFYVDGRGVPLDIEVNTAFKMAIKALQFQQGIVRCKDCKYITSSSTCDYWSSIEWFGRFTDDEEFCSRGERRDEE